MKSNKMETVPQTWWTILTLSFEILSAQASPNRLKIAIIGAGAAGLASAKNAVEKGHNVTIYEQSGALGGIWCYTDKIGKDNYGVPIHTPMYQGLRSVKFRHNI